MGCDARDIVSLDIPSLFQSTHPHGVRHDDDTPSNTSISFNPRTHMGCDYLAAVVSLSVSKFQSTHPHGVRREQAASRQRQEGFNPRTHMGCDIYFSSCGLPPRVSIHAPTWGATQALILILMSGTVSIHAPTWGATEPVHH